jgi:hypothetical protein
MRTTITTSDIATARPRSSPTGRPLKASSTAGSWRPMRMKTVPLMRNSSTCQAATPAIRTSELIRRGAWRPT